jgi:hypothetical protein
MIMEEHHEPYDISSLAETSRKAGQRLGRELMDNSGEYPCAIREAILGYMERERGLDVVYADRTLHSGVDERVATAIQGAAAEYIPSDVDDALKHFCEGAFLAGLESSAKDN